MYLRKTPVLKDSLIVFRIFTFDYIPLRASGFFNYKLKFLQNLEKKIINNAL